MILLSLIIILLLIFPVSARPEYVTQTGQPCSVCHSNSSTGELSATGEAFAVTHQWPPGEINTGQKLIKSTFGFIHLLASMIFVGSMVFVHLIHTARILSLSGVPKKELKLGWISLFFIGTSGIFLTLNRFHDLDGLLNSQSGRLVFGKIILFSIMVTFAALVTLVINKRLKTSPHHHPLLEGIESEMTPVQLQKFDGSSGETFVGFAGVIFDVTGSRLWKQGKHMGRHTAGSDLTLDFREAPHGPEVLDKFQAVAGLKTDKVHVKPSRVVKVFKTLAVINFICALLAVLLSALIAWPI